MWQADPKPRGPRTAKKRSIVREKQRRILKLCNMNVPQVKVHHRGFYQERIDLIVASQKIVMLKKIST